MANGGQDWDFDQLKAVVRDQGRRMGLLPLGFAAIVLIVIIRQAVFTVSPEQQGVMLRFGRHVRTVDPGLHFKLPLGIERVHKVPVQRQLKQEFGFRTTKAGIRSQYQKSGLEGESLMLTGDLNSADVEWVVQYRISDPLMYLFNVRRVEGTFRAIAEATMREIVGDRSVDEVITWGKAEINVEAQKALQQLATQYETGLTVQQVFLQDVNAPPPVQPSWNEVNEAEQEKDRLINEAKSRYNTEVPKARGEAERTVKEAEGYAIARVNEALGESSRFNSVYEEYRQAPEVTRRRYYLETMAEVIPKAGRKVIIDEAETGLLRLLNLEVEGGGR